MLPHPPSSLHRPPPTPPSLMAPCPNQASALPLQLPYHGRVVGSLLRAGLKFASLASQRFGSLVSPSEAFSPTAFHLVASFGRSAIRLNEDSVGLILQACLGGVAKNFNVFHLSGWMFSFSVSCKNVGFMVTTLRIFLARALVSSSTSGAEGGQIRAGTMCFGAMN